MKKAYVKAKDNSVKSILKRPYIAATIIGAAICAVVLSVSVPKEPAQEEAVEQLAVQEKPETEKPTAAPATIPEPEPEPEPEIIITPKPEITQPKTNETAVEETVSVGLFGGGKDFVMIKPAEGDVIKAHSSGKPVKSKTMGDWRVHNGMDIKAEQGTEVLAPADGEIIRAEMDGLTGATVSIDHGNGRVSTIYNLENTDGLTVGQKVKAKDKIGTAGNTAKCEMLEDPHIHFEVTINGAYVNPEEIIQ